jgi:Holliday junction DNA helicase RuvA
MIARLKGLLIEKHPTFLLIDIQGLAYECCASMHTIEQLPELNESVTLHTHLSINDNAHTLFAFYTKKERLLFRELIKVNGVGPKLALAILSSMNMDEFVHYVQQEQSIPLIKIPGVGKKTAERLIVEMKDRVKDWLPLSSEKTTQSSSIKKNVNEAISALIALGYKSQEANKAINAISDPSLSTEILIRKALKRI